MECIDRLAQNAFHLLTTYWCFWSRPNVICVCAIQLPASRREAYVRCFQSTIKLDSNVLYLQCEILSVKEHFFRTLISCGVLHQCRIINVLARNAGNEFHAIHFHHNLFTKTYCWIQRRESFGSLELFWSSKLISRVAALSNDCTLAILAELYDHSKSRAQMARWASYSGNQPFKKIFLNPKWNKEQLSAATYAIALTPASYLNVVL